MDWPKQWDLDFPINTLQQQLPWRSLQIIPVGGRGKKLNLTRERLVFPNIHRDLLRIFQNRQQKNDVSSIIGKKISDVFSQDIKEFSKKVDGKIVKCTDRNLDSVISGERILDKIEEYSDASIKSSLDLSSNVETFQNNVFVKTGEKDNDSITKSSAEMSLCSALGKNDHTIDGKVNDKDDVSNNSQIDMITCLGTFTEKVILSKPMHSQDVHHELEEGEVSSSKKDSVNTDNLDAPSLAVDVTMALNEEAADKSITYPINPVKVNTSNLDEAMCEAIQSDDSPDKNERLTCTLTRLGEDLLINGEPINSPLNVDADERPRAAVSTLIEAGFSNLTASTVEVGDNVPADSTTDVFKNENGCSSLKIVGLPTLLSSAEEMLEKVELSGKADAKGDGKTSIILSTKKEIDISSSLLSCHVDSLIKRGKIDQIGNASNNSKNNIIGIDSAAEQDRQEIQSNIIEISNNLQNRVINDKDNLEPVQKTKKAKKKDDQVKHSVSNSKVLTHDNLEGKDCAKVEHCDLLPESISHERTGIFNDSPCLDNKLEVQDIVINDNKPAKFSLRNSLITSTQSYVEQDASNKCSNTIHATVKNTLSAIPMSMVIADPMNIQSGLRFNDPKYLETLEEKELFVIIEHIPVSAVKDLEGQIRTFGTIIFFITELDFSETERIGLLKMSDPFECEFVVSCLDGYIWDDLRMVVRKALDIL